MPIERETIRKSITEKGFREKDTKRNPSHDDYYLVVNGRQTSIWIRISRGSGYKDYSDDLIKRQARILGVRFTDLYKFLDCTHSGEEFVKILKETGKLQKFSSN
jgi:hypothetical protein